MFSGSLDIVDNKIIRDRGPILFMGTLRITAENKGCLTEDGEQRLRQDLSYRIGRMDKQYFHSPDFTVTVDICGELFLEPRELECQSLVTFSFLFNDAYLFFLLKLRQLPRSLL